MKWVRTWLGGRVALVDGVERFYIRKRFGGARRELALDVETEPEAEVELRLFERDPAGYKTKSKQAAERLERGGSGVRLDAKTVDEFLAHCDERAKKGDLTSDYVDGVLRIYLSKWGGVLGGKDLSDITLDDLQKQLKKWKGVAEHKRVVAIKAFTAWARETKDAPKLKRQDDPTTDLKTPPIIPAKSIAAKGYAVELVEEVYSRMASQRVRDVILLRAKLGMHDSEIRRIAQGKVMLRRVADPSGIEGTIAFQHLKKGKPHVVSCDAQTFAAAERILSGKAVVERKTIAKSIKAATKDLLKEELGEEKFAALSAKQIEDQRTKLYPNELRHSFATWATTTGEEVWPLNKKGVDLEKVAERMGHLGKRTTAVFYVGDHVPMMIKLPLRLQHPEDPVALVQKQKGKQAG